LNGKNAVPSNQLPKVTKTERQFEKRTKKTVSTLNQKNRENLIGRVIFFRSNVEPIQDADLGNKCKMNERRQSEIVESSAHLFEKCIPPVVDISAAKRALFAQWRGGEVPVASKTDSAIRRRTDKRPAPLSLAQQQAWFFSQLEPESPLYNIPMPMRLAGKLDIPAFQKALNAIVARHEIFRTHFGLSDETCEPIQWTGETSPVPVDVIDLREVSEAQRENELCRLVRKEIRRPFNLAHDLTLRVQLFRMEKDDWGLSMVVHHIAADIWSWGILCREIATLYEGFLEHRQVSLPALSIQYADFATWQQEWLKGNEFQTHLAYWKQNLSDAPSVSELPLDYERPARQTFHGATEYLNLPDDLRAKLLELSQREGATLFMTLLGGFQALVYGYTGQEDLLIGSPAAARCRSELEGSIGFFANVLVLRTNLGGNPTFRELLRRTRSVVLDGLNHQEPPYAKLVQELRPQRSASHLPFFQILFMIQEELSQSFKLPGINATDLRVDTRTAKFDLLFSVLEEKEKLKCCAEYNIDLFQSATIRRMLERYRILLEDIVAQPDSCLSDLTTQNRMIL
jgi:hypothetical protein